MRKKAIIGLFGFVAGMTGCSSPTSTNGLSSDIGKVTVIFTDAPDQSAYRLVGGSQMPEETVNYVNRDTLSVRYIPRSVGNDTLTIPTFDGYAELWHKINGGDEALWLLKGGDSVSVTYDRHGRPHLESRLSDAHTRLYNLPWEDERAVQTKGYSLRFLVKDSRLNYIYKHLSTESRKLSAELVNQLRPAFLNIDSLSSVYQAYLNEFSHKLDSLSALGKLPEIYRKWFQKHYIEDGYELTEVLASDALLCYPSASRILRRYQAGHKSTETFDRIVQDTTLLPKAKANLLRMAVDGIQNGDYWMPYPDATIRTYTEEYIRQTGDSSVQVKAVNKPNATSVNGYTYDLALLGTDGKTYDFADVMKGFRGKVVYVDLWASWCAPCKSGMADALKLREAYQGKDVIFLYLAVDDREPGWRKEMKACRTDHLGINYLVLNTGESAFLKEIKHRLIPRFLLFDRQGTLVDTHAPRSGSPEIRPLLEKYLVEDKAEESL